MAISKGIGGYYLHSQALVADAFHALTDMVSDVMTLVTVEKANKLPTTQYPNGYGKVESLGSLAVSGLLALGGVLMLNNCGGLLYAQFFADAATAATHGHGFLNFLGLSHSHTHTIPNLNAAWLAAGSIVIKEYLYRATMKIANERDSSVLRSNAVHHRVDSLTSIVALIAIGGSHIFSNATWLDPFGGLLVSLMVINAGVRNTWAAGKELLDVSVSDEMKDSLREATKEALAEGHINSAVGVTGGSEIQIRDVQGIKAGQKYRMDLQLAVPDTWTVGQVRQVEEIVRQRVGPRVRMLGKLRIRFVATGDQQDFTDEFIGKIADPSTNLKLESQDGMEHSHIRERLDNSEPRKRY
ncbi:hypothetical protein MMC24_002528 [Lignoscripta atroalba]|nr:hypothetical protein [Lignoscripta atroalba]